MAAPRTATEIRQEMLLGAPVVPLQQQYTNFGGVPISGVFDMTALALGMYVYTLNGAASLAPAGMPTIAAGKTGHLYMRLHQDATGGRIFTLDAAILPLRNTPQPLINQKPNAYTEFHFFFDGQSWWYETSRQAPPPHRVFTTASAAALPFDCDDYDTITVTALAVALTLSAPTGTPSTGQVIRFRIKDNGTARALTWNAIFRAFGVALPTTTVINKTLYVTAQYNATDTKWDVTSVIQEV